MSKPVPVLVVPTSYGIAGIRRSAGKMTMPGGVRVISAVLGPVALPADLVPSEIHTWMPERPGRHCVEIMQVMVDALMERADMTDHAHFAEGYADTALGEDLIQTCRCGAVRGRPRGPYEWSEWS